MAGKFKGLFWNSKPANLYICHVLFEKSNSRVQRNNTLNPECKEVRDQFLENLNFSVSDHVLIPSNIRGYRAFSLTWQASMQIYRDKRRLLHKKRIQLRKDFLGTPTWPPFHCFGTPIWPP